MNRSLLSILAMLVLLSLLFGCRLPASIPMAYQTAAALPMATESAPETPAVLSLETPSVYQTAVWLALGTPTASRVPVPTQIVRPASGTIPTPTFTGNEMSPFVGFGSCKLTVHNQNPELDSVVMLVWTPNRPPDFIMYVRANESYNTGGIPDAAFTVYVALGRDWEPVSGRFLRDASYFRFKETYLFMCSSGSAPFSRREFVITISAMQDEGTEIIPMSGADFPGLTP